MSLFSVMNCIYIKDQDTLKIVSLESFFPWSYNKTLAIKHKLFVSESDFIKLH